jgi:hypothetical protein
LSGGRQPKPQGQASGQGSGQRSGGQTPHGRPTRSSRRTEA